MRKNRKISWQLSGMIIKSGKKLSHKTKLSRWGKIKAEMKEYEGSWKKAIEVLRNIPSCILLLIIGVNILNYQEKLIFNNKWMVIGTCVIVIVLAVVLYLLNMVSGFFILEDFMKRKRKILFIISAIAYFICSIGILTTSVSMQLPKRTTTNIEVIPEERVSNIPRHSTSD